MGTDTGPQLRTTGARRRRIPSYDVHDTAQEGADSFTLPEKGSAHHNLQLGHRDEIALARKRLTEEFGLGDNCDLLYTLADSLYNQLRWADCFAVTSR
jgi:hypothetical protein